VVVAHHHEQLGAGDGLAQAARELDQEALEEHALVTDARGSGGMRRQVAAQDQRARPARGRERQDLFIELARAVQVGREEPFGQIASAPDADGEATEALGEPQPRGGSHRSGRAGSGLTRNWRRRLLACIRAVRSRYFSALRTHRRPVARDPGRMSWSGPGSRRRSTTLEPGPAMPKSLRALFAAAPLLLFALVTALPGTVCASSADKTLL